MIRAGSHLETWRRKLSPATQAAGQLKISCVDICEAGATCDQRSQRLHFCRSSSQTFTTSIRANTLNTSPPQISHHGKNKEDRSKVDRGQAFASGETRSSRSSKTTNPSRQDQSAEVHCSRSEVRLSFFSQALSWLMEKKLLRKHGQHHRRR